MPRVSEHGFTFHRFENMSRQAGLSHAVFTRRAEAAGAGGLDLAPNPENAANMEAATRLLGAKRLFHAGQVHGTKALVIGADTPPQPQPGFDALITAEPRAGLLIKTADCQGVMLFDPEKRVLALAHAGWRGSVQDILGATVRRMNAEFGCRPADLLAGIGPSLGPCCAEFVNYQRELPAAFLKHMIRPNHFDFWAISRDQLTAAGLESSNIETLGLCTVCENEFHSWRRDNTPARLGVAAVMA